MNLERLVAAASAALNLDGELRLPGGDNFLDGAERVAVNLVGDFLMRAERLGGEDGDGDVALCGGMIVETEAYLGADDAASHAAVERVTARSRLFYQAGGLAYVFRAYGVHHCFNVIAGAAGSAGCVLIRAIAPLVGVERMAARRRKRAEQIYDLCSGPGKLCQALGIDAAHNGLRVNAVPPPTPNRNADALLILRRRQKEPLQIQRSARIGVSKAADRQLRFCQKDSPYASR